MPKDLSGAQVGMAPRAGVSDPRPNVPRGYNLFPQTYPFLTSLRYGEYSPFFWTKCERGDVQNLSSYHDLNTLTLKSRMLSDVSLHKSFVKVPMQAIYPRNWEKMFTIPTHGDDVPSDTRALLPVSRLVNKAIEIFNYREQNVINRIKAILLLESICSNGSLFSAFNLHFNYRFNLKTNGNLTEDLISVSFDKIFDYLCVFSRLPSIFANNPLIGDDDVFYYYSEDRISSPDGQATIKYVSFRRYLEMLRSNSYSFGDSYESVSSIFGSPDDALTIELASGYNSQASSSEDYNDRFINIEPIISYQLACAQFGTNDFVDYIYSAQLYRDNLQSIYYEDIGTPSFQYNGLVCLYDVFSERVFTDIINTDSFELIYDFFMNIFSFVPALRFGDYFTASKPRPLAIGEYSAQVQNNSVSAIDITRSIQMQRLLHRVNMVGRKLGDYLSGIYGGQLPEAPKDVPVFLTLQNFSISGFQTENTGSAQLDPSFPDTITTHLSTAADRHVFEIQIDEPCYLIGMVYFEAPRLYSRTMDRFAFHHDRYDDFIPEMQYIGDQDIKQVELDSSSNSMVPFGYCLRYMEYKKRYGYVSGAFVEDLPSWSFVTDNSDGNPPENNIDPDYIRSSPSEFDRFYKSLNGYSLGTYYHFAVKFVNKTSPARRMEYAPEILK